VALAIEVALDRGSVAALALKRGRDQGLVVGA
jgi:hypothetical protein